MLERENIMDKVKNVLITGVNGGIGLNLAKKFKQSGYVVYGLDLDPISKSDDVKYYLKLDLNNPDWSYLFKDSFDVLINNAAVQIVKEFKDFTEEDINTIFNVNLINVIRLIQKTYFNPNSSIINIGSIHSHQTKKNFSLYATTKGGLETLTKALSIELAPYTRVNMIRPAAIRTPMLVDGLTGEGYLSLEKYHPTQSIGEPDDISDIILSIIGNGFINGSIIDVDGGISNVLNDPEN